jgi:alginate O-acetyltransferase complex protein AlgI
MLFNSLEYILLFLPVTLIVYFLLNSWHWPTAAKAWLVLASFVFYCRLVPLFGLLLLLSILFNYSFGRWINRQQQRAGLLLSIAVVTNLALLGYFKYANFFIDNLGALTGWQLSLSKIVLPLGISFFTFTQIAYLVDVYRRIAHEYSMVHYFLFVTYFPHLVAGPILHHKEMMPQFADSKNNLVNWENIFSGLFIFSIGLFKKVIVADQFALWANAGFDSGRELLFHEAWVTSLSYTMQIYFDFSGYTDMAIGASLMLNIQLPLNFNSPYKAVNIQDFWQRWHMTLSRWLRDYVYIPLGGNKHGKPRTYINLVLTFLLGGLWHGANWTFVIWGALHGLASMLHKYWRDRGFAMPTFLGWFVTFMFINVTWVFFAADNFSDATHVLRGMAGLNGGAAFEWAGLQDSWVAAYSAATALDNNAALYWVALPWLVIWLPLSWLHENSMQLVARHANKPLLPLVWMGFAMAIPLFVLVFFSSRITEFIYFNF